MRNPENKHDFLAKQSHEQLEIMVLNGEMVEDNLRDRLFLLTGCSNFGGQDGTDGACIDCYYNNRDLHERCCLFQEISRKHFMSKCLAVRQAAKSEIKI